MLNHNIELILSHVLMVLFPIGLYHLFFHKQGFKGDFNIRLVLVLLLSLSLTLAFPVHYSKHLTYDLKLIPVIIAFLYGGNLSGIIILIAAMLYKILFQGGGSIITVINFTIACALLMFAFTKYRTYSITFKVICISIFYWIISLTRAGWLFYLHQSKELLLVFIFSIITWITLLAIVFIFENLNKQIKLEQMVQQAEKFDVVGQLAASVAHEVRNPMTTVRGFLQMMQDDQNLNDSQRKYIEISLKELEHSQGILTEYLSLARPASNNLVTINLTEELENMIELMKSYTNFQEVMIFPAIESSLFVKGNISELKQVFVNIIKNSIEAVGSRGEIHVSAYNKDSKVLVEIKDNGIGMSPDQLKYLGTPFYSTKVQGTGVGLTVSYKIIHSMKGNISVNSQKEKGTIFTVQLPAAE